MTGQIHQLRKKVAITQMKMRISTITEESPNGEDESNNNDDNEDSNFEESDDREDDNSNDESNGEENI